jgi:hypothetical protein
MFLKGLREFQKGLPFSMEDICLKVYIFMCFGALFILFYGGVLFTGPSKLGP